MKKRSELVQYLRDHIVGALHVGRLSAGDRLPSIRRIAAQFGINPRTVAAAYRELEQESLVELRGRSGVFVASHDVSGTETVHEMSGWLGGVVTEAWKRGIAAHRLPKLMQRAIGPRVRCGLVEQVGDALIAFQDELERDFGFEVYAIEPDDVVSAAAARGRPRKSAERIQDLDFFAVTNFYAPVIHVAAAKLGKPMVILTVHPDFENAIRAQLNQGKLTVIACDSRFADRLRVAYDPDERAEIRLISAADDPSLRKLDPEEPVLITRAARRALPSMRNPAVFSDGGVLSTDSAARLARILVRTNLSDRPMM